MSYVYYAFTKQKEATRQMIHVMESTGDGCKEMMQAILSLDFEILYLQAVLYQASSKLVHQEKK